MIKFEGRQFGWALVERLYREAGRNEMPAGSAAMTVSIPLLAESKPKLSKTILPSTPKRSLWKLGSTNGTSGMP